MAYTRKIRYSDCDPQGIVFNGNYATYFDDAVTDWLEDLGFGGEELGGIGVDLVLRRMEIDFLVPARLGDVLVTEVAVEKLGNTSFTLGLTCTREADGAVTVTGREVQVFVDPDLLRPVPIPDRFREAFGEHPAG